MKKTIMMVAAIAMTATLAQAQLVNYQNLSAGNWTAAGVWPGDVQPGTNNNALLKYDVTLDSAVGNIGGLITGRGAVSTLTINTGGALTALYDNAVIGGNNVGHLIMNDGSLSILGEGKGLNIGTKSPFGGSSVTINNGLLTIADQIKVGVNDWASLAINGGTVTAGGNLFLGTAGLSPSTVDLQGGSLSVGGLVVFGNATDTLNIENDATLILGGNSWTNINSGVLAGNITWANGTGIAGVGDKTWDNGSGSYIHTAFDGTDTTVWVNQTIPEPATLGLVAAAGAGILFIRRRFMI